MRCYEVRLNAWNCSCPAFTFSAFPLEENESETRKSETAAESMDGDEGWRFGGLSLEGAPAGTAVCKHLLAAVLVERCGGLFREGVEVREVGREEFAGWCAGWGG